jgi:hypothetical protein
MGHDAASDDFATSNVVATPFLIKWWHSARILEFPTESVFFGQYRSVFFGINSLRPMGAYYMRPLIF